MTDERQARIDAIKSDLARPWQEVEGAVETARWLLAELDAATARAERAEAALRELLACGFSGDEGRLLMVGLAGSNVSPELYRRCDRVTAAHDDARAALAEGA